MEKKQPTPGELVILVTGAVMLFGSFLDFANGRSVWQHAWFPLATLLPIYGVLMALQIAVVRFAGLSLPRTVAGFTWEQLHLAVGGLAALMAIAWLLTDVGTRQSGAWVEILGGFALTVGAVLVQSERHPGAI